ncbi:MAG: iron ABC transporter permease [Kosmotoga sp.]|uniref:Iron ABC transporter permease n=1 Tax=Kosmotoga arenicorallina TaxID=688066 RepID=A0A7C5HXZ9_9BACT|nr:iron ABC transporter permease [Kosmotoga sp.]MBO8165790.1 iron ABC transporter permease [Kosmotoga sp.]HHF08971.1 iron ABC transporter permease [Kosmotoga arenicorallina]
MYFTKQLKRIFNEPTLFITLLAVWLLLGVFVIYPIVMVAITSLKDYSGHFSWNTYKMLFTKVYFRRPLINSLKLGATVASIGTVVGFIFAFAITRVNIPGKKIFTTVATFPIVSPPFVIALAAILLFGRNGVITHDILKDSLKIDIYGFGGLSLVETLAYFPTAFLSLEGILRSINPALEEASLSMGYSKWRTFWKVTFPLSMPGIFSAWLLVFAQSMADFGNPMIISGNYQVLSVAAYLEITGSFNLSTGSGLAILLLVPTIVAFTLQKYWLSKKSYVTVTGKPSSMGILEPKKSVKALFTVILLIFTATILMFYGTVFYGSFTKLWGVNHTLSLENYKFVFDVGLEYIKDTIILAAIATPISGILGMLIAYLVARKEFPGRRFTEATSLLTFAIPGTVVGIGYLLSFNNKPFVLTGTAAIIILIFIFRNLPVGVQNGVAALEQIDKSIEEASLDMGASSATTFWKVTLPLITPAFFSGLFFTFVKSMTAISAVIFVVSGSWNLVTVAILGSVENSDLAQAAAYSYVLIFIVIIMMFLLRMLTYRFSYERKIAR